MNDMALSDSINSGWILINSERADYEYWYHFNAVSPESYQVTFNGFP